jgi:amino acid transporter
MNALPDQAHEVPARLGVTDAVSIIVGIVIGAGIFETPPLILNNVAGPGTALAVWALAGLLSLIGALCYAELATTYPRSGGDYIYLTRAYGPWVGFLFGWAQLAVILTANIGMMAYVFAQYAVKLWDGQPGTEWAWASLAVLALTALNFLGIVFGKGTQNLLTAAKVLGLAGVLAAGFLAPGAASSSGPPPNADFKSFAFAMVLVFITYGGWNDAAYVAAEQRDGRRNIPRALICGILAITLIYLLVNAAYLWALGFDGARRSNAIAADVLERSLGAWGPWGARTISLLVMISALGAANGLILTGSRVCSALGADHPVFARLGRWHHRTAAPRAALLTQALISLGMILVVGTDTGRGALDRLFTAAGLHVESWAGRNGFEILLRCTAPVFWFFFLLNALSLFVLRSRDRGLKRPFQVPLYPLLPAVFCATCAYMLYAGIEYAGKLGLIGGLLLVAGLPLYAVSRRLAGPAHGDHPASEPVGPIHSRGGTPS